LVFRQECGPTRQLSFVIVADSIPRNLIKTSMATHQNPSHTPFLLLFRNGGPDTHQHLSPEQRLKLTQQWNDWYNGLAAQNKVQHGRPLGLTGRVVSGTRGERVTDGPFAESKEVVAGYIFLAPMDLDEATEIAKNCPGLSL